MLKEKSSIYLKGMKRPWPTLLKTPLLKIKYIYFPVLAIYFGILITYSLFHWFIVLDWRLLRPDEIATTFLLPSLYLLLPILLYLPQRFKLFKIGNIELCVAMIFIAFILPILSLQEYLIENHGKITHLHKVEEISHKDYTRFYTIDRYVINKEKKLKFYYSSVTGKNHNTLKWEAYYMAPLQDITSKDQLNNSDKVWLSVHYVHELRNNLSSEEEDRNYQQFQSSTAVQFNALTAENIYYFSRPTNTEEHALKRELKERGYSGDIEILLPHDQPYQQKTLLPVWLLPLSIVYIIVWFIFTMMLPFNTKQLRSHLWAKKTPKNDLTPKDPFFQAIGTIRIWIEKWPATILLTAINICILIAMMFNNGGFFGFRTETLIEWGANVSGITDKGEWWRLVTSTFLHDGFPHLAYNMIGLVLLGITLEKLVKSIPLILCFLGCGISASFVTLHLQDNFISIGSSGAIFGLAGIYIILVLTRRLYQRYLIKYSTGWIFFILIMGFTNKVTNNTAHIAGLVVGMCIGLYLYMGLEEDPQYEKDKEMKAVLEEYKKQQK